MERRPLRTPTASRNNRLTTGVEVLAERSGRHSDSTACRHAQRFRRYSGSARGLSPRDGHRPQWRTTAVFSLPQRRHPPRQAVRSTIPRSPKQNVKTARPTALDPQLNPSSPTDPTPSSCLAQNCLQGQKPATRDGTGPQLFRRNRLARKTASRAHNSPCTPAQNSRLDSCGIQWPKVPHPAAFPQIRPGTRLGDNKLSCNVWWRK